MHDNSYGVYLRKLVAELSMERGLPVG